MIIATDRSHSANKLPGGRASADRPIDPSKMASQIVKVALKGLASLGEPGGSQGLLDRLEALVMRLEDRFG